MFLGTVDQHYNRFYDAKYFRNRVLRVQKLCSELHYDACLLVVGIDTYHDKEMKKFQNWLLYGFSGFDVENSPLNDAFNDSFLVISKDSLQAYTTPKGYPELSRLSALVPNRNIFCLTPAEEAEQDLNEVKKMAKFFEFVNDKRTIGLPARALKIDDNFANELVMIEKWPICQSYGLDIIGGGFFTMKHNVKNIREALNLIYKEYDSFAMHTVIYDEIPKNGHHFYDNFYSLLNDPPQRRCERAEKDLIEAFTFRYEFGLIGILEEHKRNDQLPIPRVLFGQNTNKEYNELSSDEKLWKINHDNTQRIPVHMTLEYVERRSSLRFGRTYMLSNCAMDYMKNFQLNDNTVESNDDTQFNEQAAHFISHAYLSMIKAFNHVKEMYFQGKISKAESHKIAYVCFLKVCQTELSLDIDQLKAIFSPKDFSIDIIKYDARGEEIDTTDPQYLTLHMIRMQQKNIKVNDSADNLGSILYSDSFYSIAGQSLNITKNIPNLMSFYTTPKHYKFVDSYWWTDKGVKCAAMGERVSSIINSEGIYPVKSQYSDVISNITL